MGAKAPITQILAEGQDLRAEAQDIRAEAQDLKAEAQLKPISQS